MPATKAPSPSTPAEGGPPLTPSYISDQASCIVVKIGHVVLRLMELRLKPFGLRARHHSVLKVLIEEGPASQQALGAMLRIDRATMVATIDDLESLGYVERRRDPSDRRRHSIGITAPGRRTIKRADAALASLDELVLADLTPTQRTRFHDAVVRISQGSALPAAFDAARAGSTPTA